MYFRKENFVVKHFCSTFFEGGVVRVFTYLRLVEMDICILQSRISKDVDIIMHDFQNLTMKNTNINFHEPRVRGIYGVYDRG